MRRRRAKNKRRKQENVHDNLLLLTATLNLVAVLIELIRILLTK